MSAAEAADGLLAHYVALLAAVPFLAAAVASWPVVLGVGVAATLTGAGFALIEPKMSLVTSVNVVAVALATGLAVAVASVRQRQAEQIVELTKLASVAQQAVLRPLGRRSGPSRSRVATSPPPPGPRSAVTCTRRSTRPTACA